MATLTLSENAELQMNDSGVPGRTTLYQVQAVRTDTRFTMRIVDVGVIDVTGQNPTVAVNGTGFTYDGNGEPTAGTVTGLEAVQANVVGIRIDGLSLPVATVVSDFRQFQDQRQYRNLFATDDTFNGAGGNDYLIGFAGNDVLYGGAGNDSIDGDEEGGAAGNDTIDGGAGNDSVRGLSGNDLIYGGPGDDDVNGNMGEDSVFGGQGADYVRGGQGNDVVYGEDGNDVHVNGNIGNDTVYGGTGNDVLFGGQNNDRLLGETGNDTLSGDLGNDTLTGGAGADRFLMGAATPGADEVTDFVFTEGDRIQLAAGTTYTVSAGTGGALLSLSNGGSVTLTGIAAASVEATWVVTG